MKKNNYSLMLSEGVVNAIDAAAARAGTNRSALINQILAEYVSYVTPEMRAKEILSRVYESLGIAFRRESVGESAISLYSSLAYRYNPTVKYCLELYRDGQNLGELRVSLRSKNPVLLQLFARFAPWLPLLNSAPSDTSNVRQGRAGSSACFVCAPRAAPSA